MSTTTKNHEQQAHKDQLTTDGLSWTKGKHLLITGASSGIGSGLCRQLLGQAAKLTMVSRNTNRKLDELVKELNSVQKALPTISQTKLNRVSLDVCDTDGIASLIESIYEKNNEQIDAFVNCAGGSHIYGLLEDMKLKDIDRIFDTNAKAPIYWLRDLLPRMKNNLIDKSEHKRAHVIMLSSRSGERALPKLSVYAAAKGSIEKLVEAIRTEYASYRIAFTLINPGSINTPFTADWSQVMQIAHNDESMNVDESLAPILLALNAPFAVNKISYQSLKQWQGEPGVLPENHG